ncbi:MAG TPA: hypothetical protein PK398_02730 [Candidatus Gracilibacteria bacterium]|nr:hypothetical protein [Candidatus Gracilibacteria bacterium]
MPLFHYTVANKENKKLSGSIEAADESIARAQLNNLGFSILEISEGPEVEQSTQSAETSQPQKPHQKYIFEAINPQGQKITGTIVSNDELSAFRRLKEEYELAVTAIYKENAKEEEVAEARAKGTYSLNQVIEQEQQLKDIGNKDLITQDRLKKEIEVRTRVEYILKQVNELLLEYDQDIPADKHKEINQRIDKLLRIKSSTNLDYVISTAEELLEFIKTTEISIKQKNYLEKRTRLKLQIKNMLSKLHETGKSKTIAEDIVKTIQKWQQKNIQKTIKIPWYTRTINNILVAIKKFFETPEEIRVLKSQIKNLNTQLFEYIKIYIKEPAKEYKQKAREAIISIWTMRKNTVAQLKEIQLRIKEEKKQKRMESSKNKVKEESSDTLEDFSEFTGWLLAFYLAYYFVSLYVITKDFGFGGLDNIPKLLNFYATSIFKYILATVFLLHAGFTIKNNFFRKSKIASLIIFPVTTFLVIFIIVNF